MYQGAIELIGHAVFEGKKVLIVDPSDLLDEGLLDTSNFVKHTYGLGTITLHFISGKTCGTCNCRNREDARMG